MDLKAIKKRLANLPNPGPWGVADKQQDDNGVTWIHFIARMFDDGDGNLKPGSPEDYIAETLDNYEDDSTAQFLAHSYADIIELVAEVERLKKRTKMIVKKHGSKCPTCKTEFIDGRHEGPG